MTDLTDFLLARVAEDEERVKDPAAATDDPQFYWAADRILAECEAKRVAVRWYLEDDHVVMGPTVKALAAVYADHPDFREEWRP